MSLVYFVLFLVKRKVFPYCLCGLVFRKGLLLLLLLLLLQLPLPVYREVPGMSSGFCPSLPLLEEENSQNAQY